MVINSIDKKKGTGGTDSDLKMIEEMHLEMMTIHQENAKLITEQARRINLHDTILRNIKAQLGQMAQELHRRPQGSLPSDTIVTPKRKE